MKNAKQARWREDTMRTIRHWTSSLKRFFDAFSVVGGSLLVAGLLLLVLATGLKVDWLRDAGGALFVAGLSLIISTSSGKEAVRQQNAKEANIRRKDEIYGPLHAELKQLRERLEDASTGKQPYPKWIDGAGNEPAYSRYVHNYMGPTFRFWPQFKSDYRIDNFTESARKVLDEAQNRAATYNVAVVATEKLSRDLLAPHVASAFESISKTADFREWDQHYRATGGPKYGWFQRIDMAISSNTPDSPFGQGVANVWLDGFGAWGWLLAGHLDQAAMSVYEGYKRQGDVIPPDPNWFQTILQMVWTDLDNHPAYREARGALAALLEQICKAEKVLQEGLHYIRDYYEGGVPPV